ncbi:MAG: 3-deoxy-D-manno-octulosonic acid transferase, partial [Candidatus Omnitrophica bacterium]|nr:3-deoxy-D-manno-octulosonic acid transferase [Candidatus Omnitrophota bacterium]
ARLNMFILYDLVFFIFILAYLPLYLLRGKFHRGFASRLGILPADLNLARPIWVHAVSVGEAVSIKGLVTQLRKTYPDKKLVISTVTATGNKIAQGLIGPGDLLLYLPLDLSFIVKHVLKKINPALFVIAETEIWPNLITQLDKQKIPIAIVNGRISDGSYSGYRAIKYIIRPILRKVSIFLLQSDTDASRLESLGVAKEKIQVTGNLKFDINLNAGLELDASAYRAKLMLGPEDKLWVCGSTHPGEEKIVFETYQKLLLIYPKLKLLLAPRHPERSREIAALASKMKFMPIFVSSISGACPTCINNPVFILDTIGQLFNYYACADIVFIGGSLIKKGGHNILEPASLKKPIIFGPHMFNFRDITDLFMKYKAGIMVNNAQELNLKVKELLANDILANDFGQRAYELISRNCGATLKNIQAIKQLKLS